MNFTPYQYLPLFAKVAIERLDQNYEMRNVNTLDSMLDAYAKTYGIDCDDETRQSARHIASRRFHNFT